MSTTPEISKASDERHDLVSVIVPAYNAAQSLNSTVESVFSDVHPEIEVIVINDGSSDGTEAVAKQIQQQHPKRLHLFSQLNSGANAARNFGLREASGKYVQFLDADDELQNNKLATSVEMFRQSPGLDCVYSRGEIESPDGSRPGIRANSDDIKKIVSRTSKLFTCGMQTALPIWRREFLIENELWWDESLPCWQEAEFHSRCLIAMRDPSRIHENEIAGLLFRRNELSEDGISSNYWSEKYILGQLDAVTKMSRTCRGAGMAAVTGQHRNYLRLLSTRAIVGNRPKAYEIVNAELRRLSANVKDTVRACVPFWLARMSYRVFRAAKRTFSRKANNAIAPVQSPTNNNAEQTA